MISFKWNFTIIFINGSFLLCMLFKGMAVAENIIDAIYKSRRTLVVMSNNFLKSMWGQFELQQAHNRAMSQVVYTKTAD